MIIEERLISINEKTRPGEKIKKVNKIVLCGIDATSTIDARNNIENMYKKKDIYLSYHYLIGNDDIILRCVPENEIAYSTYSIDTNLSSISVCIVHDNNQLKKSTLNNICNIVNDLCTKYNLDILKDVVMEYDITLKRTPKYILENSILYHNIISYKK